MIEDFILGLAIGLSILPIILGVLQLRKALKEVFGKPQKKKESKKK